MYKHDEFYWLATINYVYIFFCVPLIYYDMNYACKWSPQYYTLEAVNKVTTVLAI